MPDHLRGSLDEFRTAAARHADRLERMFGRRGVEPLRRHSDVHPAVSQIDALREFAARGSVRGGREVDVLGEIAVMQIDQRMWPTPAVRDDPWSFLPSEKLRAEMKRRLRDGGSYGDTLAELYVWAYLRDQGFEVSLTDEKGTADLAIESGGAVVYGDVKRVRVGSAVRAAGAAVTKANRQVKKSAGEDGVGVVFVHIARPLERVALDDRIPADVQGVIDEVRRELSGQHNRSIGAAITFWDDIIIVEGDASDAYFFRRRATVIRHVNAKGALAIDPDLLQPQAGFLVGIQPAEIRTIPLESRPDPKVRSRGSIVATPAYQQMNAAREGVRVGHAIDLFANPDRLSAIPGGVILATRHVAAGDFVLLGIASDRDNTTQISMAFRLYEVPDDIDPEHALELFLDRYGIPSRVGDEVALFHPSVPAPRSGPIVVIENPPEEGFAHAVAQMGAGRPDVVHCVFAFDNAKYRASVRARSA